MMNRFAIGLIVLGLAGTVALGQTEINESRRVDKDVELSVENTVGEITVRGWDSDEVLITGTLGKGVERLEIKGDESDLSIRVVYPNQRNVRRSSASTLEVRAPFSSELRVKGVSADISVREIAGDLDLQTVSGDIVVRDAAGYVDLETVSGDVEVNGDAKEIEAKTVSGDIVAERFSNAAELQVVSGDIYAEGDNIDSLEASLVSGNIEFVGSLGESADMEIECHSGSITITLPKNTQAEFDCETFSGGIKNEFGVDAERKSKHGPGRVLRYVQGGNDDAEVELKTFSGSITIKN